MLYIIFLFFLVVLFFCYVFLMKYSYHEDFKSKFYDKFNINCVVPYKRPPICVYIEGNLKFNMIDEKHCKNICPDIYKKMKRSEYPYN